MRLRNKPGAIEILKKEEKYFISDPFKFKGKWNEIFNNNNPIHIEIGSGKGNFIYTLAINNLDINYIAIEKYPSVIISLLNKIKGLDIGNLKIICIDANQINEIFDKNEVDFIYLNFSDPWPKARHAKRRLTNKRFLDLYKIILKDGGFLQLKTDNDNLFAYSVEEFKLNNWNILKHSTDLYKNLKDICPNNIATEYEEKFHKLGKNINYILLSKPQN